MRNLEGKAVLSSKIFLNAVCCRWQGWFFKEEGKRVSEDDGLPGILKAETGSLAHQGAWAPKLTLYHSREFAQSLGRPPGEAS